MNKTFILADVVHQLEITGSYTTSFECLDGSYALISGDNLTLEYNYGYTYTEVRMTLSKNIFQLSQVIKIHKSQTSH